MQTKDRIGVMDQTQKVDGEDLTEKIHRLVVGGPASVTDSMLLVIDPYQSKVTKVGFAYDKATLDFPGYRPPEETVFLLPAVSPQKKKDFECPVCMNDGDVMQVIQLQCGHAICWACATQWKATNGNDEISCPICRSVDRSGEYIGLEKDNCVEISHVEFFQFCNIGCVLTSSHRIPNLILPYVKMNTVWDVEENWWDPFYLHEKLAAVRSLMKEVVRSSNSQTRIGVVQQVCDVARPKCSWCGDSGNLLRCTGCKIHYYCSVECQTVHWKKGKHKRVCKALSALN